MHGTFSVATPVQRKLVIQQLLNGDLADLADEGLHHLLPKIKRKPWAPKKWKNNLSHQKKQENKVYGNDPSALKNTYGSPYMRKLSINEDELCFMSLENNVSLQLSKHHKNGEMVHALRKAVFPELNMRSYLHCRSDLDIQTIRCLLQTRPTDEAAELEQTLTKATNKERDRAITKHHSPALTKLAGQPRTTALKNTYNTILTIQKRQPIEFED